MFGEPACTVFALSLVLKAFVDPDAAPATVSVLPPALAHVPVLVLYSTNNALVDSSTYGRLLCCLLLLPSRTSSTAPTRRWQIVLFVDDFRAASSVYPPARPLQRQQCVGRFCWLS